MAGKHRYHRADWQQKYGAWALVTGASDGIGKATAEELASAGMNLVWVARRRPLLESLAADLSGRFGIETQVIDADLAQAAAVERVIADSAAVDVGLLVASAGFGTSGRFVDADLNTELNMLDVNNRAVLMMAHHFGQRFVERGRGGMILMSSLVAWQGVAMAAHYAATKAYIQSLAEGLHIELAAHGVDVLATAPGPIASGFATRANMQMGAALTPENVAVDTLNALGARAVVRPGLLTKFLDGSLSMMPRWGRVWAMSKVMGDMTKHQQATAKSTARQTA